jgi:hypothetical protein
MHLFCYLANATGPTDTSPAPEDSVVDTATITSTATEAEAATTAAVAESSITITAGAPATACIGHDGSMSIDETFNYTQHVHGLVVGAPLPGDNASKLGRCYLA